MPPETTPVTFRKYRPTDRDWVIDAHARHYINTEGFSVDFTHAVIGALDDLEQQINAADGDFVIAESDNRIVGCVFFAADTAQSGRIRLFYLDAPCRGRGIGKQLLNRIIAGAINNGITTIRVSTYDRHAQACGLYVSLGFQPTIHDPAKAFGQTMRQIDFERDLSGSVA